jgi:hypothetical protein
VAPPSPTPARAHERREPWLWYVLLVVPPCVGTLWVPFYNRAEPALAGIPFFYWYLFLWVGLTAALSAVVYVATRRIA